MKRQLTLNKRLANINYKEQNNILTNKIRKAKSSLNLQCPESFTFFKSKHFRNGNWKRKYCLIYLQKISKSLIISRISAVNAEK